MVFARLLGGKVFKITPDANHEVSENKTKSRHALAILAVCRQIYAETALQPFRLNTFSAEHPKVLNEWVSTLRLVCVEAITSVHLKFQISKYLSHLDFSSRMSVLKTFKQLKLGPRLLSSEACTRGQLEVAINYHFPARCPLALRLGFARRTKRLMERFRKQNKGVKFILK